jgi:hypothetical protein
MNEYLPLIVVAFFMAATAVFVSTFALILSNFGVAPSLADCGFVAVLCFGASFFEALFETLAERSHLDDEVAK